MPSKTLRFESLLEAAPDAMVGVDQAGVIRFVNRQTELLFGYGRDELVGQPIEKLVPESVRQVHPAHRADYVMAPRTRPMGLSLGRRGVRRDGTEFPVDINLSQVDSGDGLLVMAAVRGMTERDKAAANRPQLEQMAQIVEFSHDAILSVGMDGIVTSWNPSAERMLGYSGEEIIGRPVLLLTPQSHLEESRDVMARIRAGQTTENLETIRVRKDGTLFPVSLTVSPIHDEDGTIIGATSIPRDITRANAAFEVAQRMAAIVENSNDAIIGKTLDGTVTDWNSAAERMYGYSCEEIIGKSVDLLLPEQRNGEMNAILARIGAGQPVEHLETMRVRKDGRAFPVSITISPIRDPHGAVIGASTITRGVSKEKEAFEAARSMIESSLDSLVAISPEGMITDVNEATVKVTGIPREELIGTAFSDCFTEPKKANEIYQLVFDKGMAVDYPLTMHHRDGTLTEVLYNASVYRNGGGKVLGVFAAARDVTKQRQAGAQYTRSLIEAGLDSLMVISPNGKITDVNEATVKVTGIARDQLIGTDFSEYFTEPEKANDGYERALAHGSVTDYPLTMRHRDGTLTEVLYNASVYRTTDGKVLGVFAAARDVTEQNQVRAELAQQAKELDRLAELERFQRLTVGRELKMIELKKEIEHLRKLVPADEGESGDQH